MDVVLILVNFLFYDDFCLVDCVCICLMNLVVKMVKDFEIWIVRLCESGVVANVVNFIVSYSVRLVNSVMYYLFIKLLNVCIVYNFDVVIEFFW